MPKLSRSLRQRPLSHNFHVHLLIYIEKKKNQYISKNPSQSIIHATYPFCVSCTEISGIIVEDPHRPSRRGTCPITYPTSGHWAGSCPGIALQNFHRALKGDANSTPTENPPSRMEIKIAFKNIHHLLQGKRKISN